LFNIYTSNYSVFSVLTAPPGYRTVATGVAAVLRAFGGVPATVAVVLQACKGSATVVVSVSSGYKGIATVVATGLQGDGGFYHRKL
jgi:hypothetical protein